MPTRRRAPLALLVSLAALLAPAPAGAATRIDVERTAQAVVQRITARTDVAVYLPNAITIHGRHRAFASGGVQTDPQGWTVFLAYTRNCGGAHACQLAYFHAARGERPSGRPVQLARGIVGRYRPLACGASCSPASVNFAIDGVLYDFSVTDPTGKVKAALITAANQAIRYGPR